MEKAGCPEPVSQEKRYRHYAEAPHPAPRLDLLKAQPLHEADSSAAQRISESSLQRNYLHTCSTENKRVREGKRELASLSACARGAREPCELERTGRDRANAWERGPGNAVIRTVIRTDRMRQERSEARKVT